MRPLDRHEIRIVLDANSCKNFFILIFPLYFRFPITILSYTLIWPRLQLQRNRSRHIQNA